MGKNKIYLNSSIKSIEKLISSNEGSPCGINLQLRKEKIRKKGKNHLSIKSFSWKHKFLRTIKNPFIIVLSITSCWYLFSYIKDKSDSGNLFSFFLITGTILFAISIEIFQSQRFYKTSEKLQKLVKVRVKVYQPTCVSSSSTFKEKCFSKECFERLKDFNFVSKNTVSVSKKNIVLGDIIFLKAGDIIPADCRIIFSKNLFINESVLTGETYPIPKFKQGSIKKNVLHLENICFSGTNVASGFGVAVVFATGKETFFGKIISKFLYKKPSSNFDFGIRKISFVMIKIIFVVAPLVFIIKLLSSNDQQNTALIYTITVVIGLTPEILPIIISISLVKSGKKLLKKKVVVRNLSAVQNLGTINVLCFDKTGTLTSNKPVVKNWINFENKTESFVLKLAYLNSFHQSGLQNVIDQTIVTRYQKEKDRLLESNYQKIEEIPFDFTRKRVSVILQKNNERVLLICKGTTKSILQTCTFYQNGEEKIPLTQKVIKKITNLNQKYEEGGFRLIAVSYQHTNEEKNLIFAGFIVFTNELKKKTKNIISLLKKKDIKLKILTGDSLEVTKRICEELKIETRYFLSGEQINNMNNKTLGKLIIRTTFFYDLDPLQKKRIIKILKNNKKTVGFIGDGINDALALREADVGISVKNGTQIAKETADLVLLKNDLEVVKEAVSEGRKAFINILKYTKITLSSQLGDILSLIIVSIFPRITPGIPILPVQMLFKNLIYDFGQIFVSWDNVDYQQVKRPVNWDEKKIIPFALITGFVSPCFDTIFFFLIKGKVGDEKTFQTSWFIFCIIMQTLAFHIMRTEKIPFVQSQASKLLLILSASIIFVSFLLPINRQTRNLLQLSEGLDVRITTYILVLNYGYCFVLQFVKKIYIKNFKVWL